jgi:predicted nucleic acid-binding protein
LDDQRDSRIRKESLAFLEIADTALGGEIKIVSSDYVKFEVEQIIDPLKRKDVRGFERTLSSVNVTSSRRLIALARKLSSKCGLNSLDALHVSAACLGDANFFVTCDDDILNRADCIENLTAEKGYRLKVRKPVNYVKERRRVEE